MDSATLAIAFVVRCYVTTGYNNNNNSASEAIQPLVLERSNEQQCPLLARHRMQMLLKAARHENKGVLTINSDSLSAASVKLLSLDIG